MRYGSRLALFLAALGSTAVGCTGILGIADSIGYETGGGADGATDTSLPDGAQPDGALPDRAAVDGVSPDVAPQPDGGITDGPSCDADLNVDPSNCGACGHPCLGGECDGGACLPATLMAGGNNPYEIAVDDVNLYWTVHGSGGGDGQLYACPVGNCQPGQLGNAQYAVALGVAAQPGGSSGLAYFTVLIDTDAGGQVIADTAGVLSIFEPNLASDLGPIATDSQNVYFVAGQAVYTCPLGGACGNPLNPIGVGLPASLAAYGGVVYWLDAASAQVETVGVDGGTPRNLGSSFGQAGGIVADAVNVYYSDLSSGVVYECATAAGGCITSTPLATASVQGAQNLAVDSNDVYWTDGVAGTISKCAITGCGGTPTVLAYGQKNAFGIAVDATRVYWTTEEINGAVMSLAK